MGNLVGPSASGRLIMLVVTVEQQGKPWVWVSLFPLSLQGVFQSTAVQLVYQYSTITTCTFIRKKMVNLGKWESGARVSLSSSWRKRERGILPLELLSSAHPSPNHSHFWYDYHLIFFLLVMTKYSNHKTVQWWPEPVAAIPIGGIEQPICIHVYCTLYYSYMYTYTSFPLSREDSSSDVGPG